MSSLTAQPPDSWVQGDALRLPFPDADFDAATVGYGLRNVADIPAALRELRRVLRPGATVAALDFNNSENPLVDAVQVRSPLWPVQCILGSPLIRCSLAGTYLVGKAYIGENVCLWPAEAWQVTPLGEGNSGNPAGRCSQANSG
jgi:SAM-dependent methyltransferase